MYVFWNFVEVLGMVDVGEVFVGEVVRRSGWRFFFLVEELGMGFIDGWCSIKKFWWLFVGILDYSLDLNVRVECVDGCGSEVLVFW